MPADIKFGSDDVEVEGTAVFSGQIVSSTYEVTSRGSVAGFSFADRAQAIPSDAKGARYVWYCNAKVAQLWSGGVNMVSVQFGAGDRVAMKVAGNVDADDVTLKGVGSAVATIRALQDQVGNLLDQVNELRTKLGLPIVASKPVIGSPVSTDGGNGRPPLIRR